MTDTEPSPRRRTIVTGLATAGCVALACLAVIPLQDARAEGPASLAASADNEEMAEAFAYAGSHSDGYWEALTQAVAEERAAAEKAAADEKAAAERAEQLKQATLDAATYGRRIEETIGEGDLKGTRITEFIPSASGDIIDGEIYVRTTWETVGPDGTKHTETVYFAPNSARQLGVVQTETPKDGPEKVTQVVEYVPGSIDVKVGDERPVPPEGSSAAGKKPHTWDPKADGSLGKASGGQPDGGAKLQPTEPPPTQETTAAGTRVELEPEKRPDGRVVTPFFEFRPLEDLPYRSGYKIQNPAWGDTWAEVDVYSDATGKAVGAVGRVIEKGGKDTIVAVEELKPGSLGLKKGDSRPTPADILKGNVPSTWAPKPESGSGSGTTTGGTQPTGGSTTQGGSEPKQDPEPVDGERTSASPSYEPSAKGSTSTSTQEPTVKWASESYTDPEGNKHTAYNQTNSDGSKETGVKTEKPDGTTSCKVVTDAGEKDAECPGGMTDEPTCQVDCERLAMLTALFSCATGGADCGHAPEGLRPDPSSGPECDDGPINELSVGESDTTTNPVRGSQGGVDGAGAGPDCTNTDAPGGPVNYGDPLDPNGGEAPDPSQIPYLQNDGVTDPVNPGETEEVAGGNRLDFYGTLRDPANPPGTDDTAGPGAPDPSEAERRVP